MRASFTTYLVIGGNWGGVSAKRKERNKKKKEKNAIREGVFKSGHNGKATAGSWGGNQTKQRKQRVHYDKDNIWGEKPMHPSFTEKTKNVSTVARVHQNKKTKNSA